MKKRTLIIFIVAFVISALLMILGAMFKVLYPEQSFLALMLLGAIGFIVSIVFIAINVFRKALK